MWCVVHGDDFTFTGYGDDLDYITDILKKEYELKVRGRLGAGSQDVKEIDVLGRIIRLEEWGCTWQADPRHRRAVMEHFGFNDQTKPLITNGIKEDAMPEGREETILDAAESTQYRALAARFNYLAADCPNIQYATKEVCRSMSAPTVRSQERLKKLARYLVGCREVKWYYRWQSDDVDKIEVHTDSDWAGCRRTRRSTSGGCITIGKHMLKSWSTTQATVALSSAEAEFQAMIEGATRSLGLQSMLCELGAPMEVVLWTDSSAAKSYSSQRGLGRIRHLEVKNLWLQEIVCRGRLRLCKVLGTENPADILTKFLSTKEIDEGCWRMNVDITHSESTSRAS